MEVQGGLGSSWVVLGWLGVVIVAVGRSWVVLGRSSAILGDREWRTFAKTRISEASTWSQSDTMCAVGKKHPGQI